jgi:predicted ester cyclase
MSAEANKEIVRRYYAATDRQALDEIAGFMTPGFRLHFGGMPEMDQAGALGVIGMFFAAIPDVRHEALDLVGDGDRVAVRLRITGTQQGELMGVPPTGRPLDFGSTNVLRLADGKIAEQWVTADLLLALQQIGAIPAPQPAASA